MPLTHPKSIWGRQREPRAIWGFVSHFCSLTQRFAGARTARSRLLRPLLRPRGAVFTFPFAARPLLMAQCCCWDCSSPELGISLSRSMRKEES